MTPLKAIRAKCIDCCGGVNSEVKLCSIDRCPLHLFRFGKNPNRAGIGGRIDSEAKNANSTSDLTQEVQEGVYLHGQSET